MNGTLRATALDVLEYFGYAPVDEAARTLELARSLIRIREGREPADGLPPQPPARRATPSATDSETTAPTGATTTASAPTATGAAGGASGAPKGTAGPPAPRPVRLRKAAEATAPTQGAESGNAPTATAAPAATTAPEVEPGASNSLDEGREEDAD